MFVSLHENSSSCVTYFVQSCIVLNVKLKPVQGLDQLRNRFVELVILGLRIELGIPSKGISFNSFI